MLNICLPPSNFREFNFRNLAATLERAACSWVKKIEKARTAKEVKKVNRVAKAKKV